MKTYISKFLFVLFATGFILSMASCEKCRECTVFEKDTNIIYYYERHCETGSGSSNRIEEWEAELRAKYSGYYVYCNVTN
ncbi:MAG: hypothetical protein IH596_14210 [Bacteroidales bacterium]|nr:hypothetical protein [Bacteroidales bacterium]